MQASLSSHYPVLLAVASNFSTSSSLQVVWVPPFCHPPTSPLLVSYFLFIRLSLDSCSLACLSTCANDFWGLVDFSCCYTLIEWHSRGARSMQNWVAVRLAQPLLLSKKAKILSFNLGEILKRSFFFFGCDTLLGILVLLSNYMHIVKFLF